MGTIIQNVLFRLNGILSKAREFYLEDDDKVFIELTVKEVKKIVEILKEKKWK